MSNIVELYYDPEKGVVIPVTAGTLSRHGYKVSDPESRRREALDKAVRAEGSALSVFRHLIARSTQLKRVSPTSSKIMREDAEWVKKKYRGTSFWPVKKKYDIAVDMIEGKIYSRVPEPIDFEFDGSVIVRLVPELNLVEVAVGVPEDMWMEIARITTAYSPPPERPPERIIFRSWKGSKVNVFLDNAG